MPDKIAADDALLERSAFKQPLFAGFDASRRVHLKQTHRCPAGGGQADDTRPIETKVFWPRILAGMVRRNDIAAVGINRGTMADKLAAAGLIAKPERTALAAFIDAYIESRTDTKPRTVAKYRTTRKYLVDFFGAEKSLRDVTAVDASDWRRHLAGKLPAENTVRKHIAVAKVFFNDACKRRLISENPFDDQKSTIQANPDRYFFVTREMADAVLEACPDAEWRLIFALSRFGGLEHVLKALAMDGGSRQVECWGRIG